MTKSWLSRTLLSYIPLFFFVTSFLFFIFIFTLNEQNQKETARANHFLAEQAVRMVDHSLKSIDQKVTVEMLRNDNVLQYYEFGQENNLYTDVKVLRILQDWMIANPLIDSIYLVRYSDETVLTGSTTYPLQTFADKEYVESMKDTPNSRWSNVRLYRESGWEKPKSVVTLSRAVSIFSKDKGMLVLNVRTDSLRTYLSEMYNPQVSYLDFFDGAGQNVLFPEEEQAGTNERMRQLSQIHSDYTGWEAKSGMIQTGFVSFILSVYNVWFTVGIIVMIGAVGWMIYVTRKNYQPIKSIVEQIQQRASGQAADSKNGTRPNNEFKLIESTINTMFHQFNQYELQFEQDLHIKRNFFMFELLEGTRYIGMEQWKEEAAKYNLPEHFGNQLVLMIEIDNYDKFSKDYNQRDQGLLKLALDMALKENFEMGGFRVVTLWNASNQLTVMLGDDFEISDSCGNLDSALHKIRDWIGEYLKFTVTFGIGEWVAEPSALRDSYRKAGDALQFKSIYGENSFIKYDKSLQLQGNVYEYLHTLKSIADALASSKEQWKEELAALFERIRTEKMSKSDIIRLISQLTLQLDRSLSGLSADIQKIWKTDTVRSLHAAVQSFESLAELEDIYIKSLAEFDRQAEALRESRNHHMLMNEVKLFIDKNFMDANLSLETLSDRFGLNGKYVSKLFKEQFGMKFVDYLIHLRIEQAKRMLTETDEPIQTIALQLGYSSPISFSRTFKKSSGLSPGDYRKETR